MEPTNIKKLREAMGLDIARFADLIGSHENTVKNYENGRTKPTTKKTILSKLWKETFENTKPDKMSFSIEIPYDSILITELQKYIKEEVARQLELSLARMDHIKEMSDINTSLKTNLD